MLKPTTGIKRKTEEEDEEEERREEAHRTDWRKERAKLNRGEVVPEDQGTSTRSEDGGREDNEVSNFFR